MVAPRRDLWRYTKVTSRCRALAAQASQQGDPHAGRRPNALARHGGERMATWGEFIQDVKVRKMNPGGMMVSVAFMSTSRSTTWIGGQPSPGASIMASDPSSRISTT